MSEGLGSSKSRSRNAFRYVKLILLVLIIVTVLGFREDAVRAVSLLDGAVAQSDYAFVFAVLIFVVGSFFFVPQWMLIAGAVAGFGLALGGIIAWGATLLATVIHLAIGTIFKDRVRHYLNGPRWRRIEGLFNRHSLQSGFVVRLIPTGPAIVVNLAAVVAGVKKRFFFLGTAVGIIPKIVLTGLITQGLVSSAQGKQIGLWLSIVVVAGLMAFLLNRWIKSRAMEVSDTLSEK